MPKHLNLNPHVSDATRLTTIMAPPDPTPRPEDAEVMSRETNHSTAFAASKPTTANRSSTSSFRAVALDLDGTLLQSNHQLSQTTIDYLQYLHYERNITILIATGRAAPSTYEHILKLQFRDELPLICSNGSKGILCRVGSSGGDAVMEEDTTTVSSHHMSEAKRSILHQELLFDIPVPKHVVERTLELARRLGNHIMVQYYYGDTISANATTSSHYVLMHQYMELTGSKVHVVTNEDFDAYLQQGKLPSKVLVLFPTEAEGEILQAFQEEMGVSKTATIVRGSYGWFLEVLHPQVSKGHGLERMLVDHLKIPMSECIAFGDSDNDVEFLQMAGLGIAMRNAKPHIQEIADQVTEFTNDEEGVIRTLQAMELKGLLSA